MISVFVYPDEAANFSVFISMVAVIVSAQNFFVELWPLNSLFWRRLIVTKRKCMAGSANGNQWLARVNVVADGIQLILWQRSSTHAQNHQVGAFDCFPVLKAVGVFRIGKDMADVKVTNQILLREIGKRLERFVFFFRLHDHDTLSLIVLESKRIGVSNKLRTTDGRTDESLGVLND